jgi:hypothetical protein
MRAKGEGREAGMGQRRGAMKAGGVGFFVVLFWDEFTEEGEKLEW